jgi:hypothetical protein
LDRISEVFGRSGIESAVIDSSNWLGYLAEMARR